MALHVQAFCLHAGDIALMGSAQSGVAVWWNTLNRCVSSFVEMSDEIHDLDASKWELESGCWPVLVDAARFYNPCVSIHIVRLENLTGANDWGNVS